MAEANCWQLVEAGPGAGKSAVACQRVAYLIDEGCAPARILLISFTRTAVTELRDRIIAFAAAGPGAKSVRITTIDSHAWSLRTGFDDQSLPKKIGDGSFELSIERTVELFQERNPELLEFVGQLEHLIIDEAQDVMGVRSEFLVEMLRALSPECGVTILADPAQAIYGFSADDTDDAAGAASFLSRLETDCPRPLIRRVLERNHRAKDSALLELFVRARAQAQDNSRTDGHVGRVRDVIRSNAANDLGSPSYGSIADFLRAKQDESMFVLFRRRVDALVISSYCSDAGTAHRLRLSGFPTVVYPWIGWLLGGTTSPLLTREEFDETWRAKCDLAPAVFEGFARDEIWQLLCRFAATRWPDMVDLEQFRRIVARPRPPVELCRPDVGAAGPILGTIHSSKGREAETVVLVLPGGADNEAGEADRDDAAFEEGRVYYVGATRARTALITAAGTTTGVGYLNSRRIYRTVGYSKAQIEVGRDGDVDRLAHLGWNAALEVQATLAAYVSRGTPIRAIAKAEHDYAFRLSLDETGGDGITRSREIGQLSESFQYDWKRLWSLVDTSQRLRPPSTIPHLHLVDVTTIGIPEEHRWAVKHPFNLSGLALAPVIKGLAFVQFVPRYQRRSHP